MRFEERLSTLNRISPLPRILVVEIAVEILFAACARRSATA
jgi:hypothetical protein